MTRARTLSIIAVAGALAMALTFACTQQKSSKGEKFVEIDEVTDDLFMLRGGGGNTAVFITTRGVVLVDTKLADWGPAILDAVKTLTDKPVTHIINTHTHHDHVGSNDFFPASVEIIAQENTAENMKRMDEFKDPAKAHGLPDETFGDRRTVLDGRDAIDLYYFGRAHTDGDAFVVFRNSRVMHAGDVFPGTGTPFMDAANGGSGTAYPATLARAAAGIRDVDWVIAGHAGDAMRWQAFLDYGEFIDSWVGFVMRSANAGRTPEQTLTSFVPAGKFEDYDMGQAKANVEQIYRELGK